VIGEGGPYPGSLIIASCSTTVTATSGGLRDVVTFTEAWPWRRFHHAGSPNRLQQHSWWFVVSRAGKIVTHGESGNVTPQSAF
jgi:hypothetical protein